MKKPCCPEVIESLIQSNRTEFTEDDRTWLEALEENHLEKLTALDKAIETNAAAPEIKPEPLTKEQAIEVLSDTLKDPKKFLGMFPEDIREKMNFGFTQYDARRAELIEQINSNETAKAEYPEAKLNAMSITDLESLAKVVAPVDYSGVGAGGGSLQTNVQEPLLPPGVTVNKDKE